MTSFTCQDVASPLRVVHEAARTSASFTTANPLALPSPLPREFQTPPLVPPVFPLGWRRAAGTLFLSLRLTRRGFQTRFLRSDVSSHRRRPSDCFWFRGCIRRRKRSSPPRVRRRDSPFAMLNHEGKVVDLYVPRKWCDDVREKATRRRRKRGRR